MDIGQVFTNKYVARYMTSLFNLPIDSKILDPCFGKGVFLDTCIECGFLDVSGYEIDSDLYRNVRKIYPKLNLCNKDFLETEESVCYDGIIMNPPYIRHEMIDEIGGKYGFSKKTIRSINGFNQLPSNANMYMYFILKAIRLLREQGQLIVIFPSSWMKAQSGEAFEKLMLTNCRIVNQVNVFGDVFETNALVDVIILKLVKTKKIISTKYDVYEFRKGKFKSKDLSYSNIELGFSVSFSKYSNIRRGLTTGLNKMFINPEINGEYLRSIISSPKQIFGYTTTGAITDNILQLNEEYKNDKPVDEIDIYLSKWKRQIVCSKKPKTLYQKIIDDKEWYTLNDFDCKGILFSYFVRNDMKFISNLTGELVRDNFYVIYPKIDYMIMFALLNNFYTFYQLEIIGKTYGAGLLKLQKYDIEQLKFPDITKFEFSDIEKLKELANQLIETSNDRLIVDISKILSKYAKIDFDTLVSYYKQTKKHRLEV